MIRCAPSRRLLLSIARCERPRPLQTVTAHRVESLKPPPSDKATNAPRESVADPVSIAKSVSQEHQQQMTQPQEASKSRFRPRRAAMTLSPSAVIRLREILNQPQPRLVRVSIKSKGCSGSAYSLEYVDTKGKFDEEIAYDDVRVLIDSKALIRMIGSEMDWVDDRLSARFVFHNPNVKEECGCGESMTFG